MADEIRKAALAVAAHSTSVAECRELLNMLGLPSKSKRGRGRPRGVYECGDARKYAQGCRCTDCRAGHAERHREQQQRRVSDPKAADRAGHGKASTYQNYGCRCRPCTEANTAKSLAYKAQRRERAALVESGGPR